ncbi:MAG: hypothetical protein AB7V56_04475 [Candidatus Nitrosocosmicus sp.]
MKIFDKITNWFDLRSIRFVFKNRSSAGQVLSKKLLPTVEKATNSDQLRNWNSILVIGIAKGGVVVAHEIAKRFNCELATIAPLRISEASDCENTIGAILWVPSLCDTPNLVKDEYGNNYCIYLRMENRSILEEPSRSELFKRALEKSDKYIEYTTRLIEDRIVILVDDGVFSGATASVSLIWINSQNPYKLIFASPVAPLEFYDSVINNNDVFGVDHVEILKKIPPSSVQSSVSEYYENFEQMDEKLVKQLLKSYCYNRF